MHCNNSGKFGLDVVWRRLASGWAWCTSSVQTERRNLGHNQPIAPKMAFMRRRLAYGLLREGKATQRGLVFPQQFAQISLVLVAGG